MMDILKDHLHPYQGYNPVSDGQQQPTLIAMFIIHKNSISSLHLSIRYVDLHHLPDPY